MSVGYAGEWTNNAYSARCFLIPNHEKNKNQFSDKPEKKYIKTELQGFKASSGIRQQRNSSAPVLNPLLVEKAPDESTNILGMIVLFGFGKLKNN